MCFTVNVNIIKEELERRYGSTLIDHDNYRPSYYYHAFSYPELPIVTKRPDGDSEIRLLKWGLIPSWVKTTEEASKIRKMTHNARGETLGDKPSFSESFSRRRGLLPINGFYEWKHEGGGKIPYYIYHPDQTVMSLATIYDRWSSQDKTTEVFTFSVITVPANKLMAEIHNTKLRMPVIIDHKKEEEWLCSGTSREKIENMVTTYPDLLSAHTISPLIVNNRMNRNCSEIIKPYSYPGDQTLF